MLSREHHQWTLYEHIWREHSGSLIVQGMCRADLLRIKCAGANL